MFQILLFFFMTVLPLPGTIALRWALLASLLLGVLSRQPRITWSMPKALFGLFGALTFWFVVQAIWVSPDSRWALRELSGQWLPAVLAFFCGLFLFGEETPPKRLLTLVVAALGAQAVFALLVAAVVYAMHGVVPEGGTPWSLGKLETTFVNNLLLAFLAVDLLFRWGRGRRVSRLPTIIVFALALLCMFSNVVYGSRNGLIGNVLLLVSLVLIVLYKIRQGQRGRWYFFGMLALLVLIPGLMLASLHLDSRWGRFVETARIAWDIDGSRYWLDATANPAPTLSDGSPVEASAYFRIAWIRAGLRIASDYPLGVGYGRSAFAHALRLYGEKGVDHTHSGAIDLLIGGGIPGLLLWVCFLAGLAWYGMRRYLLAENPVGLILFIVAGGYLGRMCLDSVFRDHMLVLFMLILGVLLAELNAERQQN